MAIGTVVYIACELGCGAKDSVTMGLTRVLNKPVKLTRSCLELIAIVIGMAFGGSFGILTIYGVLVFGYIMQATFKVLKCNIQELNHLSIVDMFRIDNSKDKTEVEYEIAV